MGQKSIQSQKKDVLKVALFVGELMMKNGAETYRVEDSLLRICKSRGFNHVNVFTTPTVVIISDEKFDGLSFMKTIDFRGINLNKISLLNEFSREFVSNKDYDTKSAISRLYEIQNLKPYPLPIYYTFTGLGSACFACLLGGNNFLNFMLTFIIAICAAITYNQIMRLSSITVFSCLVTSFLIAVSGVLLSEIGILGDPKMLIVGSIMPLLPGVAFIKAIRDLISGNLLSGISRAFDAAMIIISIAAGVGFVLNMWYKIGGIL
ncbi:threonine/serine exporter family protein [Metaclostridioides mangenotii]|uniref:threonine/serine exporter family protein n=1 Tax=Metaclostridioides mangenotii TaxID=1540 RepID=UPI000465F59F|nr:threonine/serine exporter family protein [Clostridioides mangenotii]